MLSCVKCGRSLPKPCGNPPQCPFRGRVVHVASAKQLSRKSYYRRLAMATANLKMSRRKIGDLQADVIFGFVERGGRILWPDGRVFPTPDTLIDDAYQDGDFRMLSDLIKFGVDPKQRPQMRVLTRLRLLSLTFQIAYPDIARHFDR